MIDRIVVVASLSSLFTLYGVLLIRPYKQIVENVSTSENNSQITRSLPLPDYTKVKGEVEYSADMEETPEFSAVMYATEPIGRYYITAYNHEETGSKITASGVKCHEGTITTCAIDPKLHRFGEYFEITVNGEPRLFVAEDTGRLVKKRHVDIYFASYKAMSRHGSNYQTIYKVSFPFGKPKEV